MKTLKLELPAKTINLLAQVAESKDMTFDEYVVRVLEEYSEKECRGE